MGTDNVRKKGNKTMDPNEHPHPTAEADTDAAQSRDDIVASTAPANLADIVDDMEERITAERRSAGVTGNADADDRAQVRPVDSDDQAPD